MSKDAPTITPEEAKGISYGFGKPLTEAEFAEYRKKNNVNVMKAPDPNAPQKPVPVQLKPEKQPTMRIDELFLDDPKGFDLRGKLSQKIAEQKKRRTGKGPN